MIIKGQISQIMPEITGESKNGTWKKQDLLLEVKTKKSLRNVLVTVWNDSVALGEFSGGENVTAYCVVESKQFKSRWQTDIFAWRITRGFGTEAVVKEELEEAVHDDLPF